MQVKHCLLRFATVYFLFLETKISTLTEKKRGKLDSQYQYQYIVEILQHQISNVPILARPGPKNETLNFLLKMYCASKPSKTAKPEKVVTGACEIQEERLPFFHITIYIIFLQQLTCCSFLKYFCRDHDLQDWSSTLNRLSKGRGQL